MTRVRGGAEPGADARTSLVRAAGRLFAERGVEVVSLREITRAAGQRNTTALQYHFTDRDGLLREVLAPHLRELGQRRHALLDQYELAGRADLRELAAALVLPLIAKLSDPDGGRAYLQIAAELLGRPTRALTDDAPALLVLRDPDRSLVRWVDLVAPLLPPEAVGPPLHRRMAAIRLAHVELSRRARDAPRSDDTLFTHYLLDLVTAVLAAPVSEQTRRVLAQREDGART